jgi:hypothetical protein
VTIGRRDAQGGHGLVLFHLSAAGGSTGNAPSREMAIQGMKLPNVPPMPPKTSGGLIGRERALQAWSDPSGWHGWVSSRTVAQCGNLPALGQKRDYLQPLTRGPVTGR